MEIDGVSWSAEVGVAGEGDYDGYPRNNALSRPTLQVAQYDDPPLWPTRRLCCDDKGLSFSLDRVHFVGRADHRHAEA